jgi:hypothetical protein
MPDSYEIGTGPGFNKTTHEYGTPVNAATAYQDQFLTEAVAELLASTVAYRQRGVTLAGGQGVLPTGCVLSQDSTTGLYYKHSSGGANGQNIPVGLLRDARNTTPNGVATTVQGNLVYSGAVNAALISGTDTTSPVTGFGGGIGSGVGGAYAAAGTFLTKGRLIVGNATPANPAFPGSPFDSSEGNIFVF